MQTVSLWQTLKSGVSQSLSWPGLCLGIGASLVLNNSVGATEVIELKYKQDQLTISTAELRHFADTGEIPMELQTFLQTTEQVPQFWSGLLKQKIYISPQFLTSVIDTTTGQFVLLKLDETINTSSSGQDLDAIRSTVIAAYDDDNQISIMELLERYPVERIKIDLTNLEGAYNQAKAFIEEVLPALEIAKAFLQDLVCECPIAERIDSPQPKPLVNGNLYGQAQSEDCSQSKILTINEEGEIGSQSPHSTEVSLSQSEQ